MKSIKIISLFLIASFLFSTVSIAQRQHHRIPDTIKVMTYNIKHGAAPGLTHAKNTVDLSAVAQVIKAQDPDIVALQEVDSMWSRSNNQFQPKVLAEKTGMKYYYYSDSRSFTDTAGWGYGIALLSKYKIEDSRSLFLPYYYHKGSENWVNCITTVNFPHGRKLKFICAHFDYLYKDDRYLEATMTNTLAENTDIPVILAGDLNSRPNSRPISKLKEQFIQSCQSCELTFPSRHPRVKLDYIFYSKNSPFQVISSSVLNNDDTHFASDHLPYVVELTWKDDQQ